MCKLNSSTIMVSGGDISIPLVPNCPFHPSLFPNYSLPNLALNPKLSDFHLIHGHL